MPAPIEDVKQTLRDLLDDMDGRQTPVSDYEGADKMFMLIACCAQLIEAAVLAAANENTHEALIGLDALLLSMKRNIAERPDKGRLQ